MSLYSSQQNVIILKMDKRMIENTNQLLLEEVLDVLCKHAKRDIFVLLPEKVEERVPYLKKEIVETLKLVN